MPSTRSSGSGLTSTRSAPVCSSSRSMDANLYSIDNGKHPGKFLAGMIAQGSAQHCCCARSIKAISYQLSHISWCLLAILLLQWTSCMLYDICSISFIALQYRLSAQRHHHEQDVLRTQNLVCATTTWINIHVYSSQRAIGLQVMTLADLAMVNPRIILVLRLSLGPGPLSMFPQIGGGLRLTACEVIARCQMSSSIAKLPEVLSREWYCLKWF